MDTLEGKIKISEVNGPTSSFIPAISPPCSCTNMFPVHLSFFVVSFDAVVETTVNVEDDNVNE